jgi:hypothetical protein
MAKKLLKDRKEKALNFRCKKYLYDFMTDFVKDKPYERSDVLNKLVENFYLEYQKGNNLSRIMDMDFIFVPVDQRTMEFLKANADDCGVSVREMVVDIIHYFFMGFLSGEFTKTYGELKSGMEKDLKQETKVKA